MAFRETHTVQFEPDGRLVSEQRVAISCIALPSSLQLDAAFLKQLARDYFASVQRSTLGLVRIDYRTEETALRFLVFGDLLTFGEETLNVERTEIAWRIRGGMMRMDNRARGGQLIIGSQWERSGADLTLFIRVADYTSRLIALFGRRPGETVYHLTQGLAHKTLTLRFLREQARDLTKS